MYDKNSNGWIKHKDLVFLVFLQKIHNSLGSVSGEKLSLIFSGFRKTSHLPNQEEPSTFQPSTLNCLLLSVSDGSSSSTTTIPQHLLTAKKI